MRTLQARLPLGRDADGNPFLVAAAGVDVPVVLPRRTAGVSVSDKPKVGEVIPFGKHKGTPIDVLKETDPKYLEWLSEQDWFRQKYANFYQVIVNNGGEPAETPEHNALQLKFLELDFKRAAWLMISGECEVPEQIHAEYEQDGIDVLLAADERHIAIELKPIMGDDYPAVVRQIRGYKTIIKRRYGDHMPWLGVIVGDFQSQVATLDQLTDLFTDIWFMTVEQIEAHKRFVPRGIAARTLSRCENRHRAIKAVHDELQKQPTDSIHPTYPLWIEDDRALSDALRLCGEQPKWSTDNETYRQALKDWKLARVSALQAAAAQQVVLAYGALKKAQELLAGFTEP